MEQVKNTNRKKETGVVVSDKMDKTIVVMVEVSKMHPLYGKVMRRSRRIKAHDERNECHVGDTVRIVECRPLSRHKCWRLDSIVERAK